MKKNNCSSHYRLTDAGKPYLAVFLALFIFR